MTSPVEIYARVLFCGPSVSEVNDFAGSFAILPASSTRNGPGGNDNSVQVTIRLGHDAQLRKKATLEGFTHDWKVFVRGPEGSNIQNFVDKVVFYLHESFPKAKRVVKDPPYEVSESGYAGFELPIDIYFKSKHEPRKIRFNYDLFLQLDGSPPVHHIRCEKLTFQNPLDDFRKRLLASGGVIAGSGADHGKVESKSGTNKQLKSSESTESTKQESKPEPPKPNPPTVSKVFTDLFGSPLTKEDITTTKKTASKPTAYASSKERKEKERSSSSSKVNGGKSGSSSNLSTPSPATPPTGQDKHDKHSSSSSKSRDKDKYDKEKHKHSKEKDKYSSKRSVESPPSSEDQSSKKKKRLDSTDRSPESKNKDKERERDKDKSHKVKNEKDSNETSSLSSSRHSSHKHKSSKKDKSESEIKEIKREKESSSENKTKHHRHDSKHEREKKHSKDKERHHKDSPSKSTKKEESKNPVKLEKHVSTSSTSDKNAKKQSPPPGGNLKPFQEELSTGELSDLDPFSDDKTHKESASTTRVAAPTFKSHGLSSLMDKVGGDMSDSDNDLLSPLEDRSPPNIFSQHTPKGSPGKSPANQSPTSHLGSHKQSDSSHKNHSSSRSSSKSKHRDKTESGSAASKKAKYEKKPVKESAKEERRLCSGNADSGSQKPRNGDLNGLPHLERTGCPDRLDKDMNGLPELSNGGNQLELEQAPNGESLSVLVELQQRLMTASDNTLLRRVVELIQETGKFKIDDNMFNFDLCNLDRNTVQKLQTCLLTT